MPCCKEECIPVVGLMIFSWTKDLSQVKVYEVWHFDFESTVRHYVIGTARLSYEESSLQKEET